MAYCELWLSRPRKRSNGSQKVLCAALLDANAFWPQLRELYEIGALILECLSETWHRREFSAGALDAEAAVSRLLYALHE